MGFGADPNYQDAQGTTATLFLAVGFGEEQPSPDDARAVRIFELLLAHGADVNLTAQQDAALAYAAGADGAERDTCQS